MFTVSEATIDEVIKYSSSEYNFAVICFDENGDDGEQESLVRLTRTEEEAKRSVQNETEAYDEEVGYTFSYQKIVRTKRQDFVKKCLNFWREYDLA